MSTAKWIQFPVGFFNTAKTRLILNEPRGKEIILFYIELLCMAARLECGGSFYLCNEPIDEKTFSRLLNHRKSFVETALQVLLDHRLIEKDDLGYYVPDWYEFESENRLEKLRAYDRARKQKKRAEQKAMEDYVRWTTQGNSY